MFGSTASAFSRLVLLAIGRESLAETHSSGHVSSSTRCGLSQWSGVGPDSGDRHLTSSRLNLKHALTAATAFEEGQLCALPNPPVKGVPEGRKRLLGRTPAHGFPTGRCRFSIMRDYQLKVEELKEQDFMMM